MNKGKEICNALKEIRQQIADKNEIEYEASDCNFQGECKGTCPKCESEVRYLENELKKRTQLKKVACVAGLSLGIAMTFSACVKGDIDTPDDYISDTTNNNHLLGDILYMDGIEEDSLLTD